MQPNWRRIVLLVTDINAMYHRRCCLVLDPFFRRIAERQAGGLRGPTICASTCAVSIDYTDSFSCGSPQIFARHDSVSTVQLRLKCIEPDVHSSIAVSITRGAIHHCFNLLLASRLITTNQRLGTALKGKNKVPRIDNKQGRVPPCFPILLTAQASVHSKSSGCSSSDLRSVSASAGRYSTYRPKFCRSTLKLGADARDSKVHSKTVANLFLGS